MPSERSLTPKQQRFVEEYLLDLNATAAAARAGYSPGTARQQGERLLTNADIRAAIQAGRLAQTQRTQITKDRWLKEVAAIAFGDHRRLYRPDGTLRPVTELDGDAAAMLAGVEVFEELEGRGGSRRLVGHTRKVKAWDKVKALELLARHFGWVKDRVEMKGKLKVKKISTGSEDERRIISAALERLGVTGPSGPRNGQATEN